MLQVGLKVFSTPFEAAYQRGSEAFSKSHAHCTSAIPEPHGLGFSET